MGDAREQDDWTAVIDAEKRIKDLEAKIEQLNVKVQQYDSLADRVQALEATLQATLVSSNRPWFQSFLEWTGFGRALSASRGTDEYCEALEPCQERPIEPAALHDEQLALTGRLKDCSVPSEIQHSVVGDLVEYLTAEGLNMSPHFQHQNIIPKHEQSSTLLTHYFWPIRVVRVDEDGSRKVHYLGYNSSWDLTLTAEQWVSGRVRGLRMPAKPDAGFAVGDKVEVRMLQRTNEGDADDDKAYCWSAGRIESIAEKDIATVKIQDYEASHGGIKRVCVSLEALRPLDSDYPDLN